VATSLPLAILSIPIGMLMDRLHIKYSIWVILGLQVISQVSIAIVFLFFFKGFYSVILILRIFFGLTS
jgi:MFS family permease